MFLIVTNFYKKAGSNVNCFSAGRHKLELRQLNSLFSKKVGSAFFSGAAVDIVFLSKPEESAVADEYDAQSSAAKAISESVDIVLTRLEAAVPAGIGAGETS
jgi:hypothetical protein